MYLMHTLRRPAIVVPFRLSSPSRVRLHVFVCVKHKYKYKSIQPSQNYDHRAPSKGVNGVTSTNEAASRHPGQGDGDQRVLVIQAGRIGTRSPDGGHAT